MSISLITPDCVENCANLKKYVKKLNKKVAGK